MSGKFQAPRGTEDLLPESAALWRFLEDAFFRIAAGYGYGEIRTPTFEDTSLFLRTSGETSDVVSKEMYTFLDRSERSMTLRPELTAPTMRALIEHSAFVQGAVGRYAYAGPIYRYGRPQAGRLRQAHQIGVELVGAASREAEIEVLTLLNDVCVALGLTRHEIRINTLGTPETRAAFTDALLTHLEAWLADQDDEARAKALKNPLRLLDTKDPELKSRLVGLRPVTEFLDDASRTGLDHVIERLRAQRVNVTLDPGIVRGLDYYTGIVFELVHPNFESSLAGGGRYDGLVKQLGGSDVPAVGFGAGIERLLIARDLDQAPPPPQTDTFYAVALDDASVPVVADLATQARTVGLRVSRELNPRSLKSALRQADKMGARAAIIVGEDERGRGVAQIKDLRGGEPREAPFAEVAASLAALS